VEDDVIEEEPVKEGVDGLLPGPLSRVNGHPSAGDGEEEDGFSGGGVNELLADAILKRPGSIRVRSFSKKERPAGVGGVESEKDSSSPPQEKNDAAAMVEREVEQMAEFTFPSLSDLGNVHYRSDGRNANGDGRVLSEAAVSLTAPSVVPGAQAILEMLEGDKAPVERSDGPSVEAEIDASPAESQESEAATELDLSPDFDMTEASGPVATESAPHSEERIESTTTLLALEGANGGTPSSEQ
jgi:hypothetical protein